MLWSSNPALPKWFNMSSQRKICSRSKHGMGSGQGMKWSYSVFWKGKRLSNEEVWHRRENWTESFYRTGSKGHAQCENSRWPKAFWKGRMAYKIASPRILFSLGIFEKKAGLARGWHKYNEGDEVGELRGGKESGLKHPIIFDVYNLCQYYHSNKLSSFNVSMLKDMCGYFEIPYKSRDLKRDLLAKVSELVQECECSKE